LFTPQKWVVLARCPPSCGVTPSPSPSPSFLCYCVDPHGDEPWNVEAMISLSIDLLRPLELA
jgi:hypothetical protein